MNYPGKLGIPTACSIHDKLILAKTWLSHTRDRHTASGAVLNELDGGGARPIRASVTHLIVGSLGILIDGPKLSK